MGSLAVVIGAVTPPGRLARACHHAAGVATELGANPVHVLDMSALQLPFADGTPPADLGGDTAAVVGSIGTSDAVLLASPVYRASYSAVLKNLLDHLPIEALQGKPVGILAMGATAHHYLGVDWQLRPVLGWFGGLVPPTSVYLESRDFADGELTDAAGSNIASLVSCLLGFAAAASAPVGPVPLAAIRR